MAAHYFENKHLGRGGSHGGNVKTGFTDGRGDVFGHRAKARTAVGDWQVVVHGLGYVDGLDRVAQRLGQLGDLQARVGGVAAAVIEEVADIVGLEDFNQALILGAVGFQAFQLVAAGAECAGRGVAQASDVFS